MNDTDELLARVLAAHGGRARWSQLAAVEAVISARGFLFTTRRVTPLHRVRARAETAAARLDLYDWPQPGWRGEWHGESEVRLVAADGTVAASRMQPRAAFRHWRRQLWWDPLDFLYFAGYATWNYLTAPVLLQRPGFTFAGLPAAADGSHRLAVRFPADVPSHCRDQVFHFAPDGELRRLDYTAEVVGGWAHAAHLCADYREFDGLRLPTTRRVFPLFHRARPLPWPTLVALDVHDGRGIPHAA